MLSSQFLNILKETVSYDMETGFFTWIRTSCGKKIGERAETVHPKGYLWVRIDGEKYLAHRLAWAYMMGCWPENQIDHIDRNKKNNSWKNLLDVSGTENLGNSREIWAHNKSGVKGVLFYPRYNKWQASLKYNGKQLYLGRFVNKEDAVVARKTAEEKYFGR